jgi:hypothetical protein
MIAASTLPENDSFCTAFKTGHHEHDILHTEYQINGELLLLSCRDRTRKGPSGNV